MDDKLHHGVGAGIPIYDEMHLLTPEQKMAGVGLPRPARRNIGRGSGPDGRPAPGVAKRRKKRKMAKDSRRKNR